MLKFDLLLLPLLGGYVFLITFSLTKFYHQRIERQRLIFNSLVLGFFVSVIGLLFDEYILKNSYLLNTREFIGKLVTIDYPGLNYSILIFLISYPLAKIFNLILSYKRVFNFVINRWGDDFEKIFWFSLINKNDEDKLLMITTKTNKVYVGYVNRISEPIGNSYITVIPNFSGYRDKEKQIFIVTTDYIPVLEHFINNNQVSLIDSKMGIIIPKSEIILISKFDYKVFDKFNNIKESNDNLDEATLEDMIESSI